MESNPASRDHLHLLDSLDGKRTNEIHRLAGESPAFLHLPPLITFLTDGEVLLSLMALGSKAGQIRMAQTTLVYLSILEQLLLTVGLLLGLQLVSLMEQAEAEGWVQGVRTAG